MIHVAIVQNIIRYKVIFTFPIALRAFVKGVEIEESAALIAKNASESVAGSHFWYLGINSTKYGAITARPVTDGKIKKTEANNVFSTAYDKCFGSCASRENVGKVIRITLSIISRKG